MLVIAFGESNIIMNYVISLEMDWFEWGSFRLYIGQV